MKNFKDRRDKGNFPSLSNPLKKTTDAVENITDNLPTENLSPLKDIPNKLTETVENVTGKPSLPGLTFLRGILRYIKNFFGFLFTPIRNIFLSIKRLFQLFIAIPIKIYLFTLKIISKVWSWIKAIVKACINLIIKMYKFIIDTISKIFLWLKILFQLFIAIPVKIYLFILKIISKVWSWLQAIVKACINLIIKMYKFIIDTISKIFLWLKILFQLFIAIPVKIYLFILKAIDKIWSWLKAGVKLFIKLITIIGQLLKLLFLNPLALLTNPLQSLKSIGNSGGEIVDNLSEGLEKVTDNLSEGIEEVTDNLSEGIEEVTDNLSEGLEKVTDNLPDGLEEVTDNLSEGLEKVTDNLPDGLEEVTDNLSEGLEKVTDNLSEGLEKVTGNLLGSRQNKKTKNQERKPLGKSKKKIPESDPPPLQQDSSELPTDIVEQFQPPDEASPSGIPLFLESSEPPTDIEQEDPDVVSPVEISEISDEVYKQNEELIYIQDLYSNGKASNLYTLDIKSGKTVLIGSMGMYIVDIAFCGNILYGIRWRDSKTTDLVRINPNTAKTIIIGKLGNSKVASLAFSKHRNALYAMGPQTLLRVNVKTGSGRIIKSYKSYYPLYCGGLAFDNKGRGYSDFGNNYNQQRYLMRLNNNATPIPVGSASGVKNSGCLDFYGDELFAIFNGQIFKYDLVTGKARLVTYTEKNVSWAGMSVKLHPCTS